MTKNKKQQKKSATDTATDNEQVILRDTSGKNTTIAIRKKYVLRYDDLANDLDNY